MWITLLIFCGKKVVNIVKLLALTDEKKGIKSFAQFIHKLVIELSTIIYARAFAFIHLSTYTTTATI
jgi:hypothetical protein